MQVPGGGICTSNAPVLWHVPDGPLGEAPCEDAAPSGTSKAPVLHRALAVEALPCSHGHMSHELFPERVSAGQSRLEPVWVPGAEHWGTCVRHFHKQTCKVTGR